MTDENIYKDETHATGVETFHARFSEEFLWLYQTHLKSLTEHGNGNMFLSDLMQAWTRSRPIENNSDEIEISTKINPKLSTIFREECKNRGVDESAQIQMLLYYASIALEALKADDYYEDDRHAHVSCLQATKHQPK